MDFLRSKPGISGSPEQRIVEISAAIERVDAERDAANQVIAAHHALREGLLLDDATTDEQIVAHDLLLDKAHLRLERLSALENELADRLRQAQAEIDEREHRAAFDRRHDAAVEYGAALLEAHERRQAFLRAHGDFVRAAGKVGIPVAGFSDHPFVPDGDAHARFAAATESARAAEDARRKRLDAEGSL